MKVTSIEEAKDLERLVINELISSLESFQMNLDEAKRFKKFEANSNVPKSKPKGIMIKEEVEKDKKKGDHKNFIVFATNTIGEEYFDEDSSGGTDKDFLKTYK
ncbi:hypothetical protein Golax_019628, partial [Gossypium laxum]|nr:hypothetical protein [Gossypium laxum]